MALATQFSATESCCACSSRGTYFAQLIFVNYFFLQFVALLVAVYRPCSATTIVQVKLSALHVATSHFYHDSYFRRFRSVYNLTLLLVTFCLWFVVDEIATLP